jgi:hypothetical protein
MGKDFRPLEKDQAPVSCVSSFGYQDYDYLTKRLSRLGVYHRIVNINDGIGFNLYVPENMVELCRDLFWDGGLTDNDGIHVQDIAVLDIKRKGWFG